MKQFGVQLTEPEKKIEEKVYTEVSDGEVAVGVR